MPPAFDEQHQKGQIEDALAKLRSAMPSHVLEDPRLTYPAALMAAQFPCIPAGELGRVLVAVSMVCQGFINDCRDEDVKPEAETIISLVSGLGVKLAASPAPD